MNISPGPIDGTFFIQSQKKEDERGFFTRVFCADSFRSAGLQDNFPQSNVSFNKVRGTFRGLHMQRAPHEEVKVVRCTKGAIFDVVVDMRENSATYLKWFGVNLSAESLQAIYIPKGFAHGFQTLTDDAEVHYLMGANFQPDSSVGFRWDDPMIQVVLPLPITKISVADQSYPLLQKLAP